MSNALKVIVVAVLGYAVYEAIDGYLRHRTASDAPAGTPSAAPRKLRPIPEPLGHVHGAAITGGGEGVTARTATGGSERVGRGVVRRNG